MAARATDDPALDETLRETFPASDPPANTVESGIRVGPPPDPVVDNRDDSRFELTVDGHTAVLNYERTPKSLVLVHTEVPEPLRGRRVGDALVKAALAGARGEGLRIVAVCPFVRAYFRKHPQPDAR